MLIKTHISLRLGDGSYLGAPWELSGSSLGARRSCRYCTYLANANYWAPLSKYNDNDEIEMTQHVSSTKSDNKVQRNLQTMILTWINQHTNKSKFFAKKASTMVLDSGVTSHFVRPDKNLPVTGVSNKVVALANRSKINATHTTDLPFNALTNDARKAHVLPGLRPNSLISVGKLADAGCTTIFYPARQGVAVHRKKSVHIRLLHKPVLQGWRDENGL
jgi:hypothetical protein